MEETDSSVADVVVDVSMVAKEVAIIITTMTVVVITTVVVVAITTITNISIRINITIIIIRTLTVLPRTRIQTIRAIPQYTVTAQSVDCRLLLVTVVTKGVIIVAAQAVVMYVPMIVIICTGTVGTTLTKTEIKYGLRSQS